MVTFMLKAPEVVSDSLNAVVKQTIEVDVED
jgi:hypothetical protein